MQHVSILIKPASSACNMKCSYCFYEDVASLQGAGVSGISGRGTNGAGDRGGNEAGRAILLVFISGRGTDACGTFLLRADSPVGRKNIKKKGF